MQQVPIEEVLAEFRQKYRVVPEELEVSEQHEIQNEIPVLHKSKSKHLPFIKIVAAQGIVAVILFIAAVALRLFNFELYQYITQTVFSKL